MIEEQKVLHEGFPIEILKSALRDFVKAKENAIRSRRCPPQENFIASIKIDDYNSVLKLIERIEND